MAFKASDFRIGDALRFSLGSRNEYCVVYHIGRGLVDVISPEGHRCMWNIDFVKEIVEVADGHRRIGC